MALVQRNNNLFGRWLTKNRWDSFRDFLDTEERPSAGVRGYQARQQFQASLKRDPDAVYSAVRRRLAEAIETDEATLPGAAMRTFFANNVPLGSMRGLAYTLRLPPHSSGKPRSGTTWLRSKLRWFS